MHCFLTRYAFTPPTSFAPPSPLPSAASVPALSFRCKVGQVCDEVMRVPLVNMAWERALATWGQCGMSADEHRRRALTCTFHSSSVRADTAAAKFRAEQVLPGSKRWRSGGRGGLFLFFWLWNFLTSSPAVWALFPFQAAQLSEEAAVEYKVEVSLPQYFTLPDTVKIPITQEDGVPWDNPAGKNSTCHVARFLRRNGDIECLHF